MSNQRSSLSTKPFFRLQIPPSTYCRTYDNCDDGCRMKDDAGCLCRVQSSANRRVFPPSVLLHHKMARLRRPKAECRGSGVNDARRPYIKRRKAWDKAMKNLFTKLSEDGWIYVFFDGVFEGNGIYKLGKAKDFICRMQQWNHCCPNPDRIWLEAFWTPKAIRVSVLVFAMNGSILTTFLHVVRIGSTYRPGGAL